jgi:hypothetical protein
MADIILTSSESLFCFLLENIKANLFNLQLRDIESLGQLRNLANLSVDGNPMSELPHARHFIIFCIKSLDILDSHEVSSDDRRIAAERFSTGLFQIGEGLIHLTFQL